MDFERRAEKALARGEVVRAVLALAEGLKRRPDRDAALEMLVDCYVGRVERPGLEPDVVEALVSQPDGVELLREVHRELVDSEREAMARGFRRAAESEGIELESGVREPSGEKLEEDEADHESASRDDRDECEARSGSPTDPRSPSRSMESEGGEERSAPEVATPTGRLAEDSGSDAESAADEASEEEAVRSSSRWRSGRIALAIIVLVVGSVAVWQLGLGAGREAVSAGPLRSLDPSRPGVASRAESWGRKAGLGKAAARERRHFVEAIRALESGEAISFDGAPATSWGRAARAAAALSRDDVAAAVEAQTRLDRSARSEGLATLWASARVAEARERVERATEMYERTVERFPGFVPGLTGGMRMAFARLDAARLAELSDLLRSTAAQHPYLELGSIGLPNGAGRQANVGEAADEQGDSARDVADAYDSTFLEVARTFSEARSALREGAYGRAVERASAVVERRPNLAPAIWVRALASAARFDVSAADRDFGRIVELPNLAETYRWRLVVEAPLALMGAGRPDLGAKYMLPGAGSIPTVPRPLAGSEDAGAERRMPELAGPADGPEAVVSRASKWTFRPSSAAEVSRSLVERAHLVRIRVVMELGHLSRVRRLFAGLPDFRRHGRRLALLRAEVDARRGRHPAGTTDWANNAASPEEKLVDAYYSGTYERAIEVGRRLLEEGAGVRVGRFVALSQAAIDRGRRARETLRGIELEPAQGPALARIRSRIVARVSTGRSPSSEIGRAFRKTVPTSVSSAVDRAALHLWRHDTDAALTWSGTAVARSPDFSEGNWFHGIVLRIRGKSKTADAFLRRAWRAEQGGSRLSLELGYVHLALDQFEQARERFFRALLADPESIEAIRGLGRAYERFDHDQGRWNFERILENYQGDASRAVQAAEVLRWLAVFSGSREGETSARTFLERATERAGDRAVLLLEKARFARASGEVGRARELFVEALERDSTLAAAHLGLAKLAAKGDNERAVRRHLERYLAVGPRGEAAAWAQEKLRRLHRSGGAGE